MSVTRRTFLAGSTALGVGSLLGFRGHCVKAAEPLVKGTPNADKLGWRVGFSTYSFRALTLFETLEKIAQTGLHCAEAFAWQKLSPEHPEAKVDPGLSAPLRKAAQTEGGRLWRTDHWLLYRVGEPRCGEGLLRVRRRHGFRVPRE